ncbi:MAG: phosphoribosylformylglycinamidine synthase subunit PurL, partial [Chloroflexales bacterium]|nr:phosphoribosylformylglycinamidine synthase subunit PurL [Chloroflexales bacterium]
AALHGAIRAGLVRACHDLSEGGLAVAAAEMVIAGDLGLSLDLAAAPGAAGALAALFSETPSRFLVEVRPDAAAAFEAAMAGITLAQVGAVTADATLRLRQGEVSLIELDADILRQRWKSGLDGIDL